MSDSPTAAPAPAPSTSAPAASPAPAAVTAANGAPAAASGAKTPEGTNLPFADAAAAGNDHPEAKPGETKAETAQRVKLKLKVSGREEEREFSESELQLYVQKGMGADEKFQQAAKVQKSFAELQKALKENPFEALKDPAFGLNLEELAIQHLAKKFQEEDLQKADPGKYELEQYKAKVAAYEAKETAAKEAQAAAQREAQDAKMWEQTSAQWTNALEKSGLGANPAYVKNMAQIALEFIDQGLDLNPEHIVLEMKDRMAQQQKLIYGGLKGEQLAKALGDDLVNELLAHKVAQLKAAKPVQEPIKSPVAAPPAPKMDAKSSERDALKGMFSFLRDE